MYLFKNKLFMVYNGRERDRMVNYYFYKLVCNDLNVKHTYIGSTVNFTRRKSCHKSCSTNPKKAHQKIYSCMAENGGFANWQMVLIEQRFFETKLEAHRHERWFFEQLNSDIAMNTKFPQRDAAEYRLNNKEHIGARNKYYYAENKEDRIAYQKDYYAENKEHIGARCQVKHDCACGGRYTAKHLSRHIKTNKHTAYIAQIKK